MAIIDLEMKKWAAVGLVIYKAPFGNLYLTNFE
jgi:hypothetical protein